MNHRDYKNFAPDRYYHVYNRGNAKADIFREDSDYTFFLSRLKENLFPPHTDTASSEAFLLKRAVLPPDSYSLVSYCLMPNHFHFLLKQRTDVSISRLILKLNTSYAKRFNAKYQQTGHLMQDQFKAILVDTNDYLLRLSMYIHNNPVTARLVKNPEDWPWSSYKEHIAALVHEPVCGICDVGIITDQFASVADYKKFATQGLELLRERKDMEKLLIDL